VHVGSVPDGRLLVRDELDAVRMAGRGALISTYTRKMPQPLFATFAPELAGSVRPIDDDVHPSMTVAHVADSHHTGTVTGS
jgi:hypothetical protein